MDLPTGEPITVSQSVSFAAKSRFHVSSDTPLAGSNASSMAATETLVFLSTLALLPSVRT